MSQPHRRRSLSVKGRKAKTGNWSSEQSPAYPHDVLAGASPAHRSLPMRDLWFLLGLPVASWLRNRGTGGFELGAAVHQHRKRSLRLPSDEAAPRRSVATERHGQLMERKGTSTHPGWVGGTLGQSFAPPSQAALLEEEKRMQTEEFTREVLEKGRSTRGGWSKAQLALLGIEWPPRKGWPQQVQGRHFPREVLQQFEALRAPR